MLETRFGDDPLAGLKDSTSPGNLSDIWVKIDQ